MEIQKNKAHHKSKEKKGSNTKAFAYATPGRLQRQVARSHDLKEKRLHVPLVDRLPTDAPPLIVAVVGPPGVGKTTLVKSLIRRYTKQSVSTPAGPLTVVTSNKRRLTFIECPSDSLTSMIDISKVVDIVLLMIDGNYGFEMETMEFLNVLAASGMPGNVFGILTHLDLFKRPSTLRLAKKRLKHRFWSELYQGAKLFYLSGVINGRYPDREIHNLSRFLSVMKNPRPLVWRNSHPYCLVDRVLDITAPTDIEEDPKCDRRIALYGYVRGTNFTSEGARVHIPGIGDLTVSSIESLPDPCPTPFMDQVSGQGRKRLGEKQKVLFAPMSDVGGVLVDKDAVYIDVKTSSFDQDGESLGLGEQMVVGLQGERRLLGEVDEGVRLFEHSQTIANAQETDTGRKHQRSARLIEDETAIEDNSDDGDDGEDGEDVEDVDAEADFADSDSDLGSIDETGAIQWKSNLAENARMNFISTKTFRTSDFARLLYDDSVTPNELIQLWKENDLPASNDEVDEEEFFTKADDLNEVEDLISYDYNALEQRWTDQVRIKALCGRFSMSIPEPHDSSKTDDEAQTDDEGDGAFEDLETGDVVEGEDSEAAVAAEREKNIKRKEELRLRFEEEDREGFANDKANARAAPEEFGEDEWYEAQKEKLQKQLDINRSEFDNLDEESRVKVEGYKAGTYVRFVFSSVPCEFIAKFNPRFPILIGGLSPTEDRFGYVQVRIKRHRWHKKILKTNDPLIFSMGWRRFQTLPIYSTSDNRVRNRMLKYTPEHMHCYATFYGPLIAPNTGFCCVQSFSNQTPGFRISATGVVLSLDDNVEIVKKLKLTGIPYKIFRNTAFIKNMFNSALEVAKFEGASIKTVSGVRGQIKRALSKPEGHFRATFEDKILMSDICFLRAWYPIKPHRFYNPVTNLLDEPDNDAGAWKGMRITSEVRAAENIAVPVQKNSQYTPIQRQTRHFNPLRVPRKLAADLPFKSQIVQMRPQKKQTYMQKRAVILGGEEKRARDLLNKVLTLRNERESKRHAKAEENRQKYVKKQAEDEAKKQDREKRERDEFWRHEGRKRKFEGQDTGGKRSKR